MTTLPARAYLSDFKYVEQSGNNYSPRSGTVKINGQTYYNGIEFSNGFCRDRWSFDYDLSKQYATFTSTSGLPDTGRTDSPIVLAVYVDGTKVFEEQLTIGTVKELNLSVANALRLRFEFIRLNSRYCTSVALGDPELVP